MLRLPSTYTKESGKQENCKQYFPAQASDVKIEFVSVFFEELGAWLRNYK